ncbi:MAG: hypothetical protein QNJ16_02035 [Rhodobacter sp.]|nr:hypothetical protein [Rhodobacter sp.]
MWGGQFNPIVPVFRVHPKEWRPEIFELENGAEVAKGYIEFFEPDVFVEAEHGLLESIGLKKVSGDREIRRRVFTLDELLACQPNRDWASLAVGLEISDVLREIYVTEQRFKLRDRRLASVFSPVSGSAYVEAMYGVYPANQSERYFSQQYKDVFEPNEVEANAEGWRKVFLRGAYTPLRVTRYGLETDRAWHDDIVIYIFDEKCTPDIVDLWNLRLEPNPIIPVPISLFPELVGDIVEIIKGEHRRLQGNPQGIMHQSTVELSRSLSEQQIEKITSLLPETLPKGAWSLKKWRNRIWKRTTIEDVRRPRPLRVTAKESRQRLKVDHGEHVTTGFSTLSPDFASVYGPGFCARWVNVVKAEQADDWSIATVIPHNTENPDWPRLDFLGERVNVGSEGWCFTQQFKDSIETIELLSHEDAIIGSLEQIGVEVAVSEPGHIGRQILNQLGGKFGIGLLKDAETLKTLNDMAGGIRVRGDSEEVFDRRTKSVAEWHSLMAKRSNRSRLGKTDISHFTDRNVIVLGVTSDCPYCTEVNWHSLREVDYNLICGRCLGGYRFPQGALRRQNGNWAYRVTGPFATPDYARGSYGTLLAIDFLSGTTFFRNEMTFSPGLRLKIDHGEPCEADYVGWLARWNFGNRLPPDLIIGEAKSFGEGDLIKPGDIAQLRRMASRFPGSIIVVSVLRDEFTENEKHALRSLVRWARRPTWEFEPTNPVILLTGTELFNDIPLDVTWKSKGEPFCKFADYHHTQNLRRLAEATQAIYLDLPSFHEDQKAKIAKLNRRKQKKSR